MKKLKKINNKMGFTLLELVVSIFLFSVVMGSITTIFILSVRQQRIILKNQNVLDQTSYALEFMSRSLRMAGRDSSGSCVGVAECNYATTSNGIKFKNNLDGGDCQEFFLENDQLKYKKSSWPAEGIPLTATSSIKVKQLKFEVKGNCESDNIQPLVTIFLDIENPMQGGEKIKIQTSISQRNLDYQNE